MRYAALLGLFLIATVTLFPAAASAQFIDNFDGGVVKLDPAGATGWHFATGDGTATMDFREGGPGFGSMLVDATTDKRGIWWALVERKVSGSMDLTLLQKPGYALRIEARVRSSHAPRRINLQIMTRRTSDYHSNLMEFEIPDAGEWHTFSMTASHLDVRPGDTVIGHIAMMDWGLEKYRLDIDYIRVDVINTATAEADKGEAVPYHPPVAEVASFAQHVPVAQDSMIDLENTDVNLNDWYVREESGNKLNLLTVDGTHYVILRWDLGAFAGKKVIGGGLLELTTYNVQQKAERLKDFGILRVVEILSGDPKWEQQTVTTESLCHHEPLNRVLNTQMIIDWPVTEGNGNKTYLTISQPTLQRMVEGKSYGIALKALGAISAAFYAMENDGGSRGARLHFNVQK